MTQTAAERVHQLRENLYRIRAEKPGSGHALDAYVRYMREASRAGMNPTALQQHSTDEVERFFANTVPGPDGHVYWVGGTRFSRNDGKVRSPNRWWWEHIHGEIGTSTYRVRPKCGDKSCITPEHSECVYFRERRYTDDQLIGLIKTTAVRVGRTPSKTDFDSQVFGITHTGVAYFLGGTWNTALAAAGLAPRPHYRKSSPEKAVESIRRFREIAGYWPNTEDFRRHPEIRATLQAEGLPAWPDVICDHIGPAWKDALRRAQAA